jgi:hypothetical protein
MVNYTPSRKDVILGWLVFIGIIGSMVLEAVWR